MVSDIGTYHGGRWKGTEQTPAERLLELRRGKGPQKQR